MTANTNIFDDSPEGRIQRLRGALQEIARYQHGGARSTAEMALANDDYAQERDAKAWDDYLKLFRGETPPPRQVYGE